MFKMSYNSSDLNDVLPQASIVTTVTILILVAAITFIGNCLLLATIWKEKQLRQPLFILLVNFLVGDIVLVSISLPLNIATFLANGPPFGTVVCHLQVFVTNGTLTTSACFLTVIAMYRLLQVCYSNLIDKVTSWKWLLGTTIISWAAPIVLSAVFGGTAEYEPLTYSCSFTEIKLTIVMVFCFYVPMVVIVIFCYVKIYLFTRKSRQRVEAIQPRPRENNTRKLTEKRDEVVFKMMMLIFLEFLFFYVCPGILNALLRLFTLNFQYHVSLAAFLLFRMRPAVNSVTCIITNRDLRNGVKKLSKFTRHFPERDGTGRSKT